jgi:hypothetical protein
LTLKQLATFSKTGAGGMTQVVEHLSSKCNPSAAEGERENIEQNEKVYYHQRTRINLKQPNLRINR